MRWLKTKVSDEINSHIKRITFFMAEHPEYVNFNEIKHCTRHTELIPFLEKYVHNWEVDTGKEYKPDYGRTE